MACQDTVPPNTCGTEETGARSKRTIKLTPKALQNAIEDKRRKIIKSRRKLLNVMQSVEELNDDSQIETEARDLAVASEEFGNLLRELLDLYEQNPQGEYVKEARLTEENQILERALL